MIAITVDHDQLLWCHQRRLVNNSWNSNATRSAAILPPTSRVARVAHDSHCSQSGEFVFSATTHCCTVHSDTPGSPPQRTTGCWCCDSSLPPRHVACITVQLITVSKCPISPSLYSRWLRLSRLSGVIAIRLVPYHKWSPRIPGDLIAIKCWSRQAIHLLTILAVVANCK